VPVLPPRIDTGGDVPRMRVCPQCKEGFQLSPTGRPPTYCSATCRKAAWEARRLQAAVDRAVEAERRRANRGNETPPATGTIPLFSDAG